ncbi:MAG: hypothetical protein AAF149_02860 [Bacteroidota bacterium]
MLITFISYKKTNYEITFDNAHEEAKKILTEDFYWNPVEEGSPFGNDDGYDAFYSFYDWKKQTRPQIMSNSLANS